MRFLSMSSRFSPTKNGNNNWQLGGALLSSSFSLSLLVGKILIFSSSLFRPCWNKVNVERALAAEGRNSGHNVQGHVDGTARLSARRADGDALWMTFQIDGDLLQWVSCLLAIVPVP